MIDEGNYYFEASFSMHNIIFSLPFSLLPQLGMIMVQGHPCYSLTSLKHISYVTIILCSVREINGVG